MVQCDLLGRQTRSLLTFEIRTHLTLKVSIEGMTGQVGSETKALNRGLLIAVWSCALWAYRGRFQTSRQWFGRRQAACGAQSSLRRVRVISAGVDYRAGI